MKNEQKYCKACKTLQPINMFDQTSKNNEQLRPWCKPCYRAYQAQYRQNNKERRKAWMAANKPPKKLGLKPSMIIIAERLINESCVICGESNPLKLDFNHIDASQKEFNIAQLRNSNPELLKKELDKCEVMCRNCHGEVTAFQNNSWRLQLLSEETRKQFFEQNDYKVNLRRKQPEFETIKDTFLD